MLHRGPDQSYPQDLEIRSGSSNERLKTEESEDIQSYMRQTRQSNILCSRLSMPLGSKIINQNKANLTKNIPIKKPKSKLDSRLLDSWLRQSGDIIHLMNKLKSN